MTTPDETAALSSKASALYERGLAADPPLLVLPIEDLAAVQELADVSLARYLRQGAPIPGSELVMWPHARASTTRSFSREAVQALRTERAGGNKR
ncbi:hypothetical protein GCM10023403_10470 [Pseudonocardia benzenivorans]